VKVILLAAGFGTRLRPLTNSIPKCLVPINGKPLLGIWIKNLYERGIRSFLINTHYLAGNVSDYVLKSSFKDICTVVFEKKLLGTAGTLIANASFIGEEECLFIHADNYCLADFDAFLRAHHNRPKNCQITMMTFRANTPSSCGIVEIDDQDIVTAFHEKKVDPPGNLANGAIYILSREAISIIKNEMTNATDFSLEILPKFMGRIYSYETSALFLDIGTPENYTKANDEAN